MNSYILILIDGLTLGVVPSIGMSWSDRVKLETKQDVYLRVHGGGARPARPNLRQV